MIDVIKMEIGLSWVDGSYKFRLLFAKYEERLTKQIKQSSKVTTNSNHNYLVVNILNKSLL
jgi:hypothetical protein